MSDSPPFKKSIIVIKGPESRRTPFEFETNICPRDVVELFICI